LSSGFLRRVDGIARTADAIVDGDFEKRIPERGTQDDLDRLARTLNRMLDRIGELMIGMRQVSNAAAHELRTPLARLRQQLETALAESQPASGVEFALQRRSRRRTGSWTPSPRCCGSPNRGRHPPRRISPDRPRKRRGGDHRGLRRAGRGPGPRPWWVDRAGARIRATGTSSPSCWRTWSRTQPAYSHWHDIEVGLIATPTGAGSGWPTTGPGVPAKSTSGSSTASTARSRSRRRWIGP